jgi:hypothetical protein
MTACPTMLASRPWPFFDHIKSRSQGRKNSALVGNRKVQISGPSLSQSEKFPDRLRGSFSLKMRRRGGSSAAG